MEKIINILMGRDGLSYEDAREAYLECQAAIIDAVECGEYTEVDEILMSELCLEPDYIFCFI